MKILRDKVSISSTFYGQLLRVQIPKAQKIQSSCQFFCAFGISNLGSGCAKAAHRMLMKLTQGDNFISSLHKQLFLYKSVLQNFSALTVCVYIFVGVTILAKKLPVKCL